MTVIQFPEFRPNPRNQRVSGAAAALLQLQEYIHRHPNSGPGVGRSRSPHLATGHSRRGHPVFALLVLAGIVAGMVWAVTK